MKSEVKQKLPAKAKRRPNGGKGRKRTPGMTRLSAKNQITIPVAVVRKAGLKPGEEMIVEVDERGQIVLQAEAAVDPVTACAGALTGVYGPNYLEELRAGDLEREARLGLVTPESDE